MASALRAVGVRPSTAQALCKTLRFSRRCWAGCRHATPGTEISDDLPQRTHLLAKDLRHPSVEEKRKHKKCLVLNPNSHTVDVKSPECCKTTILFHHAPTVGLCVGLSMVLCPPTGGKASLTEGCSFRCKQH
ncbi:40S ribosomal protein S27-like [Bos indicus x Bos taurus]|uniref:40S ribosomal protein S27-like n=1 Tax=Bos indicus x Bos taurus TaxID=30522 RepID=UPI000F7D3E64|nr:40S ribosomal protein S27-like [Bos indicus x Bos taurus]